MIRPNFASLVLLPTIITEPGKYLTRRDEEVTISKVSTRHDYGCTGKYSCGTLDDWHKSGRLFTGTESINDIVSKV